MKKKYKCGDCGKKATLVCDEEMHFFCDECAEADTECPRCEPSYLWKMK